LREVVTERIGIAAALKPAAQPLFWRSMSATPPDKPTAPQPPPQPAPEPAFFDNPAIDNLIAVTLELGAELWVQRERMRVIEKLLADKGVVTAELIEQYQPSAEELARSRVDRDAFVSRVYGAFARQTVKATP
jgi:hypothetical protein